MLDAERTTMGTNATIVAMSIISSLVKTSLIMNLVYLHTQRIKPGSTSILQTKIHLSP